MFGDGGRRRKEEEVKRVERAKRRREIEEKIEILESIIERVKEEDRVRRIRIDEAKRKAGEL